MAKNKDFDIHERDRQTVLWVKVAALVYDINNNPHVAEIFTSGTYQQKIDELAKYDLTEEDCYEFKEDLEGANVTIQGIWFILEKELE